MGARMGATPEREFLSTPSARRATPGDTTNSIKLRFLSTPSARRATLSASPLAGSVYISIHALREEGDEPKKHRARQSV